MVYDYLFSNSLARVNEKKLTLLLTEYEFSVESQPVETRE